jgi:hypothetical protein
MKRMAFLKLAGGGVLCGAVYVGILLASVSLCVALFVLPARLGFDEFLFRRTEQSFWFAPIGIVTMLLELFFPFYAGRLFYRLCDRLAIRAFGLGETAERA